MSKRSVDEMSKELLKLSPKGQAGQLLLSPGLQAAPVMDLMCSHFVLTLAAKQGPKFNVRRDLNSLLALSGRHMVWPTHVFNRVREFLTRRCKDNEFWRGHELLVTKSSSSAMVHGAARMKRGRCSSI